MRAQPLPESTRIIADEPTMRSGIKPALADLFERATEGSSERPQLGPGSIGLFGAPGSGLTTIRLLAENELKARNCSVFSVDMRDCRDETSLLTTVLKQLSGSDKKMRVFWRRYTFSRFLKSRGIPALLSLCLIVLTVGTLTYLEPGWLGNLTGIKILDPADGQITIDLTVERTILVALIVAILWVGREVLKTVGRSISDSISGAILSKSPERITWDEFRRCVAALRAGTGSQPWVIPVELQECEPDQISRIFDVFGELIQAQYRLVIIGDEAYLRSAMALRYKELLQLDPNALALIKYRFDRIVTFPIRIPDPIAVSDMSFMLGASEIISRSKHESTRPDFSEIISNVLLTVIQNLRLNPRQVKRLVNECRFYLKYIDPDTEKSARLLVGAVALSQLRPELLFGMLDDVTVTETGKDGQTLIQLCSEMKENARELEATLALLGVSAP